LSDSEWPGTLFVVKLKRVLTRLLLSYACAFICALFVPGFVHRREYNQALFAWYKNPTAENASALAKVKRKNDLLKIEERAIWAIILMPLAYPLIAVLSPAKSVKQAC